VKVSLTTTELQFQKLVMFSLHLYMHLPSADMDIMLNGTKFVSVSARRFMVSGRAGDKACHIAMTPHHFIIAEVCLSTMLR